MNPLNLHDVENYIQENIGTEFHGKKIAKLQDLTLEDILKRKNPYLFKAKHIKDASEFVESVLNATVSSGEETVFGNFLEKVAIHVCSLVWGGRKSGIKGLDLEFEDGKTKFLISIKSGPNWGNSSQIGAMVQKFTEIKKTLSTSGGSRGMNIVCIEACCYGVDDKPEKGTHQKLCGQRFWELISGGKKNLYRDIIEPLGFKAREKNKELDDLYHTKKNIFVRDFISDFCNDGIIDWDKLVVYNSGKKR